MANQSANYALRNAIESNQSDIKAKSDNSTLNYY